MDQYHGDYIMGLAHLEPEVSKLGNRIETGHQDPYRTVEELYCSVLDPNP
jgi:hypothetical protein